jgi:2-methylcitrate dehydratase PrpD
MQLETRLADFIGDTQLGAMPSEAVQVVNLMLRSAVATGVAGASEDGIGALRELLRSRGGAAQARTLVHGDRLPAHAAAQLNGTMCRALDFCDAMAPGIHIGSSVVPAALAAAELRGGCSGADFLAALAVGCELGARFNLSESMYDGFDPTGVAIVFAATATAARILRLSPRQTVHALGLAFNRCGGSFQSNIDGSLAVRMIQGWVAQTGIECAQMAQHGITGPPNFLVGLYGYTHLYGRDRLEPALVVEGLGREWRLLQMMFKKYPSCGATQGMTELMLHLVHTLELKPAQVQAVQVRLPPYCHKLVGHAFTLGDNPRVNAQFSAQYCIANAIVRGASRLPHFRPEQVADAQVLALIERVECVADPALDARGHTAVDLRLLTHDGQLHERQLDIAPGYPGNPLSEAQHLGRFNDCMDYAAIRLPSGQVASLLDKLGRLATLPDATALLDDLVCSA